MSEYKLTNELLKLSLSQKWDEAKLEWELTGIEKVEEPEECLCGHYPILEICIIENEKTHEVTRVGNCCVKKFNNKSDKIFRAVAKIKKDREKSVNAETLWLANKNGWINTISYEFYMNILRKRKLTPKQLGWKRALNWKIALMVNKKRVPK